LTLAVFATAIVVSLYPLLDVFVPSVTIRWQVRSTVRHDDARRQVGEWFQRMLGIYALNNPWNDVGARRRVRLFGAAQLCIIWTLVAVFLVT
jgi:hypothetical protein